MDRYPYHEYTILLGATRALAHIGVYFTHRVFGLSSMPEPSPPAAAQISSPQLSSASRIRRPIFHFDPITGNVDCHPKDFHGESYYDIPALAADPRFRDSMLLIQRYSLLPFMTLRQFFYLRVVLEFTTP